MTFALTDNLCQDLINALENQQKSFLVDAENCTLIEKNDSVSADEEFFYEIPKWTSADGFTLREDFANGLHSPFAKDDLQQVLHSGRGVFKNFKIVLKNYPEVEKKWHVYKNNAFSILINDWYNDLRELWGLEKLDQLPETDENLIHDDFSFTSIEGGFDIEELSTFIRPIIMNDCQDRSEVPGTAIYEMWVNQFAKTDSTEHYGFICRSPSDDFAGCIVASPVSEKQNNVMILSSFFVQEKFRGLGIGSELLSLCLSELSKNGKSWILIPILITPEKLEPLLFRMGFEKIGSGYAAKLQ